MIGLEQSAEPRVVKIAPGEDARLWDDCLANGYIRVGWDDVGDLSRFDTRDAFLVEFARRYPYEGHKPTMSRKANEVWTLRELQPGDLIVANKGTDEVVGVGTVIEPGYRWVESLPDHRHTVTVAWDTTRAGKVPRISHWFGQTVGDVPSDVLSRLGLLEPAGLTSDDFDVLARHPRGEPWDSLPEADRLAYVSLRRKLLGYAAGLAQRLISKVELVPFASHPNPSGRNPLYLWSCAFPGSVPNKSYGFQLAVIVKPESVEFGFFEGSGTGGSTNEEKLHGLQEEFARSRVRLEDLREDPMVAAVAADAEGSGFVLRPKWLRESKERGYGSIAEWIDHATSANGAGAAISKFLTRDEALALGDDFEDLLTLELTRFVPLLDALYPRVKKSRPVAPEPSVVQVPRAPDVPTFDWLMKQTLWSEGDLRAVIGTVSASSPQIVLAGPPGTGKTWVAKAIATYLTEGRPDGVRLVQFHPSYTYEQFVEGLRPVVRDGAITFDRVDGAVLDLVRTMDDDEPRVLVIDEMNRANLPRVLGELMYLFEYRNEEIALQYSPSFRLPADLLFIGTMNTADRSIRSIDIALRRRFDVFECQPDPDILERYYRAGRISEVSDLIDGFVALNAALEKELDRHHTIGHTFFMADPMTSERLRHVWRHKIGPLIEEYFFDRPDLAAGYIPSAFWPSLSGA